MLYEYYILRFNENVILESNGLSKYFMEHPVNAVYLYYLCRGKKTLLYYAFVFKMASPPHKVSIN